MDSHPTNAFPNPIIMHENLPTTQKPSTQQEPPSGTSHPFDFFIAFFSLLASLLPISSLYTSSAVSVFLFAFADFELFTLTVTSGSEVPTFTLDLVCEESLR